jgi:hypothetical protein
MKSALFTCLFLINFLAGYSQSVSINTDGSLPHASAILDVKSGVKGMLLPRTSTSSRHAIVNPAKGLIVYDTTTGGLWIHNGSAWLQLSVGNNAWNLTGNTTINPANNFIGTTDEQQSIIEAFQKQVEAAKAEIPMQTGKQQEIIKNQQQQLKDQQKQLERQEKRLTALETK